MFLSKAVFFIIASSCIAYSAQEGQVKLVLYYEGLCPYCHDFIKEQLYSGAQQLGDALSVDLVPYGNARYTKNEDGSVSFDCQHGPKECLINKIHACAIDQNPTQDQLLSFVYCDLVGSSSSNTDEQLLATGQKCAEENDLSADKINSCVSSSASDDLLLAYANRQAGLNPKVPWVPNIRFNDVFDEDLEDSAREDLVSTVCNLIDGDKPNICKQALTKVHPMSTKPKTTLPKF